MKSILIVLKVFGMVCLSGIALAATPETIEGTVSKVIMGAPYGGKVIIKISGEITPSSNPSCRSNSDYDYVFDASTVHGKVMLSSLLMAYSSKATVVAYSESTPNCSLFPGIENLNQLLLK